MNDLEKAKSLLIQNHLTLIIIKRGETLFETKSNRISGFLNAIEQLGKKLEDAAVADKVAGKAVALLCVYSGINAVYAEILSTKAKEVFEKNRITHQWKTLVENILDQNRQDTCPFEKEAKTVTSPNEAYERFNILKQRMIHCR